MAIGLDEKEIFGEDLALSKVMHRSEKLHNSVDLMEAFAKVANAIKREYGVKIRLPVFPLETPISEVMTALILEIEKTNPEACRNDTEASTL